MGEKIFNGKVGENVENSLILSMLSLSSFQGSIQVLAISQSTGETSLFNIQLIPDLFC